MVHQAQSLVDDPVLRRPEVERLTGKTRSGIYRDVAAGIFPTPIKIGPRAVGWLQSEVLAWREQQAANRVRRGQ